MAEQIIEQRIRQLLGRLDEVEAALGRPEVYENQKKYREFTQEHAYLSDVRRSWEEKCSLERQLADVQLLLREEKEGELLSLMKEEELQLKERLVALNESVEQLLIPPDPLDHRSTIMEFRAGTGGDEAALFVGDCVRMYRLYADAKGWRCELLTCTPSELGGYKEYVMALSGQNVYRFLRYEGGTHRVQRIPATESQGRVHTSAITIAVLPEAEEEDDVKIDEKDLRIDTYRASGAGGQHVNRTDSAVRITHLPTGIVAACQEERSQHKNKDKAMRRLRAELMRLEEEKRMQELATERASQVGSGDRSEKIRTFNFPQNRVTDHRINYTTHNLDQVMNGRLDPFTSALVSYFREARLRETG